MPLLFGLPTQFEPVITEYRVGPDQTYYRRASTLWVDDASDRWVPFTFVSWTYKDGDFLSGPLREEVIPDHVLEAAGPRHRSATS